RRGAGGDHLCRLLAEEVVVVGQIAVRVLLGVVAEREVAERGEPRLPVPLRVLPGLADPGSRLRERIRRRAPGDPAGAVAGGTIERGLDAAPDQDLRHASLPGAD